MINLHKFNIFNFNEQHSSIILTFQDLSHVKFNHRLYIQRKTSSRQIATKSSFFYLNQTQHFKFSQIKYTIAKTFNRTGLINRQIPTIDLTHKFHTEIRTIIF